MKGFFSKFFKKKIINDEYIIDSPSFENDLMDNKDFNLLIGDKIVEIRIFFERLGENDWLEYNLTYIILEKNGIINFPFGYENFQNVKLDKRSEPISKKYQPLLYDQTIKDFYFQLDENHEWDPDSNSFIELSNGYFLFENTMAPHGTGQANLFILTQKEFVEKVKNNKLILTSWKNELQKG